jgi:DDE superfamily endonuclease
MDSAAQPLDSLRAFRNSLYRCFDRRADALFELTDALLTAGTVPSPVHLSLASAHRRGWGSLYAALSRGRIEEGLLRELLARHASTGDASYAPVYAVDVSVWSRCDAEASPGRGYYYHPSRHSSGQPIVAGWAYQLVVGLSFECDSWVAPTDARRVRPEEDANEVAVAQVKDLLRRRTPGTREAVPLFVFDAGYDPLKLQRGLEGHRAHLLVRLHSNRAFYTDPEEVEPRPVGRPRRHGSKFALPDPETWPEPASERCCLTGDYGEVRVRAWAGLHPKTRRIGERYRCQRAPIVRGTVILVEVAKLPRETRKPKKLWLWWHGEGEPDLGLLWRAYVRRFDLEHTIRFLKQTLGWTTPRVRHPEQADRWTWLVLLAYAQLGLARSCAEDRRLPWERPQQDRRLTPCRTLRGFAALLAAVGTPARAPKPCGRSPGRPKGRLSGRRKRYPALKKGA